MVRQFLLISWFIIISTIFYYVTAVSSGVSFVLSSILTVLLFSGMQMYKVWLGSSQLGTVLGGWVGSLLFMCTLTAVGNLESTLFGKSFQQKLLPEGMQKSSVCIICSTWNELFNSTYIKIS